MDDDVSLRLLHNICCVRHRLGSRVIEPVLTLEVSEWKNENLSSNGSSFHKAAGICDARRRNRMSVTNVTQHKNLNSMGWIFLSRECVCLRLNIGKGVCDISDQPRKEAITIHNSSEG